MRQVLAATARVEIPFKAAFAKSGVPAIDSRTPTSDERYLQLIILYF
jgi:hypothetical protein